ncbi:MAG: hypothetical protein WEC37_02720 [Anaerolineales bacterium]
MAHLIEYGFAPELTSKPPPEWQAAFAAVRAGILVAFGALASPTALALLLCLSHLMPPY